ncbi:Lumazine-binding domain containing protein [Candidatus Pelagibacterales bacterium]
MFTGIIKNIGVIKDLKEKNNGYFLSVISDLSFVKKDIGTSISCSGVCLTLTTIKKKEKKRTIFLFIKTHNFNICF